jgi:Amt family ammonium transporter
MRIESLKKAALPALAGLSALALSAGAAFAATAPVPDKGDTAWMLVSTILVLLMIVPGLALFYGGLVRTKNMLSILTQTLVITCIVMIVWALWGYSEAFSDGAGLNVWVGGFSKAFLKGVDTATTVETFSRGVVIPEIVFVAFQMTFAAITTALVIGGFAERMKFAAICAFSILWPTLVYFPIAHMVWWWPGPEFASTHPADATAAGAGFIWAKGALDFAGGTVVHINAGIAALVGAILCGKRIGYKTEAMAPHSLTLTMVGAALLWVGWFGFNAGSNLESNGYAGLAMLNTFLATAAAGISWPAFEWILKGKPSLLGAASGVVAGLVAITPAAGFAGPMGAIVLGLLVSPICLFFVSVVKNKLGYDDSLDVFGVHCIGGITGAIATGILVNPALGGAGIVDYTANGAAVYPGLVPQVISQLWGVGTTILWSGIGSLIVFGLIKVTIGLRVKPDVEREGLDIAEHGERAYNM